jgi:NhaA family Na+:H+ antiporter
MEHGLQKFVAFVVMPLFAFANAGLHFDSLNASLFTNTITLGIIFGLFIGKPLGITSLVYIANKIKLVELPDGITIKQIFAVSILCGIGFTMSLFVSSLSFGNNSIESIEAKIGILLGSIVSGIIGYLVLRK